MQMLQGPFGHYADAGSNTCRASHRFGSFKGAIPVAAPYTDSTPRGRAITHFPPLRRCRSAAVLPFRYTAAWGGAIGNAGARHHRPLTQMTPQDFKHFERSFLAFELSRRKLAVLEAAV
jgi:hypothetical protein